MLTVSRGRRPGNLTDSFQDSVVEVCFAFHIGANGCQLNSLGELDRDSMLVFSSLLAFTGRTRCLALLDIEIDDERTILGLFEGPADVSREHILGWP